MNNEFDPNPNNHYITPMYTVSGGKSDEEKLAELQNDRSNINAEIQNLEEKKKTDAFQSRIDKGEVKICGTCKNQDHLKRFETGSEERGGRDSMHPRYTHIFYEDCPECKGKGFFERVWQ